MPNQAGRPRVSSWPGARTLQASARRPSLVYACSISGERIVWSSCPRYAPPSVYPAARKRGISFLAYPRRIPYLRKATGRYGDRARVCHIVPSNSFGRSHPRRAQSCVSISGPMTKNAFLTLDQGNEIVTAPTKDEGLIKPRRVIDSLWLNCPRCQFTTIYSVSEAKSRIRIWAG